MALSAGQMQEAIVKNLKEKTGKTLNEWIKIAKSIKSAKPSELVKELKTTYNLGHIQAQTIVGRMNGLKPYIETDGYESLIFKTKIQLKLFKRVKATILEIGKDISDKPCKTYIPFYRKNQFAIITVVKNEVVLGLNLPIKNFEHIENTTKLGGSKRINKFIIISNLGTAYFELVKEAYKNN
jgi:predicted transport protein